MGAFITFSVLTLLAAQLMLLARIWMKRDCTGISGKTQQLYAIIFLARHLDLFSSNNLLTIDHYLLKITFIAVSYSLVISIFFFHWETYQSRYDTFRIELLVIPCLVLSFLANYGIDFRDVFWAFSMYLECVAIIPQVYLVARAKKVESIVYRYIGLLSIYKIIHLVDAIQTQLQLGKYHCDRIALAAGTVQLLFYCDFFLTDYTNIAKGEVMDEEANTPSEKKEKEAQGENGGKGIVLTPALLIKNEKITIA